MPKVLVNSTNPCLIIYLLDQSSSMAAPFGHLNISKAEALANAVNDTISEIIQRCSAGYEIKNRFELSVLGYGGDNIVHSAWEGNLHGKWAVPVRTVLENCISSTDNMLRWISPKAQGSTPMAKAFENAKRICSDWINWGNHFDCHPPIILNITDGEATDGQHGNQNIWNEINQIKSLHTSHGSVNIFNIHISSLIQDRILFPDNNLDLKGEYEKFLFDISSPLDESQLSNARSMGYNVNSGSKGYIFNGNGSDLIKFLNVGSILI